MKFKFNDDVLITHGFFAGCYGVVTDYVESDNTYLVEGNKDASGYKKEFQRWIKNNDLTKKN